MWHVIKRNQAAIARDGKRRAEGDHFPDFVSLSTRPHREGGSVVRADRFNRGEFPATHGVLNGSRARLPTRPTRACCSRSTRGCSPSSGRTQPTSWRPGAPGCARASSPTCGAWGLTPRCGTKRRERPLPCHGVPDQCPAPVAGPVDSPADTSGVRMRSFFLFSPSAMDDCLELVVVVVVVFDHNVRARCVLRKTANGSSAKCGSGSVGHASGARLHGVWWWCVWLQ